MVRDHHQLLDWALHAPQHLRALVRGDDVFLVVLAAIAGILAGFGVVAINVITGLMHEKFFLLPAGTGLSESINVPLQRVFFVPILGGAVLGLSLLILSKLRPRPLVDPVEANALYGGRVSLNDSLIVALQTGWSNGVGASVGLEAGYAQWGAGIASRLGRSFRLRRGDLRVLVGAGAAAAIGGAFNAPLCGAFYGIELIIGVYSITTLPAVVTAALAGTLTVELCGYGTPVLQVVLPQTIPSVIYLPVLILGVCAGLLGIAIMRGVTAIESGFRRSGIPLWARPVFGGAVVGALGCITPKVLSSGHSALHSYIDVSFPFFAVLGFFILKAVASAFSIGAGFRGGLFFASLFLGALFGKVFAGIMVFVPCLPAMPNGFYAVVGMSALATAIVGGPMTMTFLALESTENFAVTMAVLAASILAAVTVKRLFGYSFATWRFHLRGENIRSAVDIGWIKSLTVARMMRPGQAVVATSTPLSVFRQEFPLGSTQRVIAVDSENRYAGLVYPAEIFVVTGQNRVIGDVLHHAQDFLRPEMSVKEALAIFESAEADALAVIDDPLSRQVVGLLTEPYALKRYNEELDRKRRELAGE